MTTTKDDDAALVLGIFVKVVDTPNPNFDALLKCVDKVSGTEEHHECTQFNGQNLYDSVLPDNKDRFFYYKGSLTTPDYNEIVNWVVFEQPITMSAEQLESLTTFMKTHDGHEVLVGRNVRDIQPICERYVYSSYPVGANGQPPLPPTPERYIRMRERVRRVLESVFAGKRAKVSIQE